MHRKTWSESGVSEVIGTILILAMTVVLFASIIVWVSSIPTPQATTRLDMDGGLAPTYDGGGTWTGANITVQHRGGEALSYDTTQVLLQIESGVTITSDVLRTKGVDAGTPYGVDGQDSDWDVGETWTYLNYPIEATDRVTVLVVDTVKSLIVWSEVLLGPEGTHPPFFIQKWADGDLETPFTIDIPVTGQTFGLFAKVIDPDGDLDRDSVTFTLSFGPLGTYPMFDDGQNGDALENDGIFTRLDSGLQPKTSWDQGIIFFHAEDTAGHSSDSRTVFQVVQAPGSGGGGGGGGGPFDLYYRNEFQAYAIFEETEWDALKYSANETRTFKKGEVVVVIVASQYLKNLGLLNNFLLYDPNDVPQDPIVYSGPPYDQNPGTNTRPSGTRAFTFLEFVSDFYVWEYRFSTSSSADGFDGVQLQYGHFHLEIDLRADNIAPPKNRFATVDKLTVTDQNGEGVPDFPLLEFFSDSGHTNPTTEFLYTDTLHARVKVQNTVSGGPWPIPVAWGAVSFGDVVISDFIGGFQVWARPGTPPVSVVDDNGTRYYKFSIDLSSPNGDPWIIGRNSYGFEVRWVADNTPEDYTLASQVVIFGPKWRLDIASALEEFSHPVFASKWYAVFNEHGQPWSTWLIESWDSAPSQPQPPFGGGKFYQIALADFDEDRDLDAVVGIEKSKVFVYRNVIGNGHEWVRTQVADYGGSNEVWGVAAGRIDLDSDNDIAVGLKDGRVFWYSNEGSLWQQSALIVDLPAEVKAVKLADADKDGDKDLFIGRQDNRWTYYLNNGVGGFGSPVTCDVGAIVYDIVPADMDDDLDNDLVAAVGANVRIYRNNNGSFDCSTITTLTSSAGLVFAVDVGYNNGDDRLDVIGGTEQGQIYSWNNTATGAWPRWSIHLLPNSDKVYSLRFGDVDGDGRDDFVIGTEKGLIRWFRHLKTEFFSNTLILSITTKIFDVDIGDADRGVTIDRSV